MANKRLHLRIHGRVQGVFYRASTRDEARRLGLRGWVCNLANGGVEVLAEGDEQALGKLLRWARRGPPSAEVSGVDSSWEPYIGNLGPFSVRY